MTEKERLQALQVLDDFMSEEDEEFYESDYQVTTNNIQMSGKVISSAQERF